VEVAAASMSRAKQYFLAIAKFFGQKTAAKNEK